MYNSHCKTKPFPLCKFNLVRNEYFSIVYKYAGMVGFFPAVRIQFRTSKKRYQILYLTTHMQLILFIGEYVSMYKYPLDINCSLSTNILSAASRSRGFAVLHILQCLQLSQHSYLTLSKSHCY